MSKILEFNARDFSVDTTVEGNCAARVFVTLLGQHIEQFEIGDWRWQWSQILCDKELEPNTDYVLRFATTYGMCDTQDEYCRCVITPVDQWEERMEFDLAHSRFQPVISKAIEDGGLLRIFEIPFNTRDITHYRILFVSQHCITKIMPAFALDVYANLPDLTYAELWNNRPQQKHTSKRGGGCAIDLSGAVIPADILRDLLRHAGGNGTIDLSGTVVSECNGTTRAADEICEEDSEHDAVMYDWLLESIARNGTMRLPEIAQHMAISAAEAQKYLHTLMECGLLCHDAEQGGYRLLQQ